MRQHVLVDFKVGVLGRFSGYLSWAYSDDGRAWHADLIEEHNNRQNKEGLETGAEVTAEPWRADIAEVAIGGVFAALLTEEPLDNSMESRLVVDAIRRSRSDLQDASHEKLSDYLQQQSTSELRGLASNVKGIYHELWYVERYNANHEDTFARVFGATNHPGADVEIIDVETGQVLHSLQLKAVESTTLVDKHLDRYPHIEVAATEEVALQMNTPEVTSSGFSNQTLGADVSNVVDDLSSHSSSSRAGDSALIALGISSTAELIQMLRGEVAFPEAVSNTAARVGVAAGATALTALLFG